MKAIIFSAWFISILSLSISTSLLRRRACALTVALSRLMVSRRATGSLAPAPAINSSACTAALETARLPEGIIVTYTEFSVSELVNLMAGSSSDPGWPRRCKFGAMTNGSHHMAAKPADIGRRTRAQAAPLQLASV